jgi:hypothetical protein
LGECPTSSQSPIAVGRVSNRRSRGVDLKRCGSPFFFDEAPEYAYLLVSGHADPAVPDLKACGASIRSQPNRHGFARANAAWLRLNVILYNLDGSSATPA